MLNLVDLVKIVAGEHDHYPVLHQRRRQIVHEIHRMAVHILEIADDKYDWLGLRELEQEALHISKVTLQVVHTLGKALGFLFAGKEIALKLRRYARKGFILFYLFRTEGLQILLDQGKECLVVGARAVVIKEEVFTTQEMVTE
ncbi:hypothetical protein DSECCO2_549390 [anaerobic digester metagenome]